MKAILVSIVFLIILGILLHVRWQETEKCKIVINTHVAYTKPLKVLMDSLRAANFREWDRVIVVVGGDKRHSIAYENVLGERVMVIRGTDNGRDWHAFHQLWVYRKDKRVAASAYFVMDDTCVVDHDFPSSIDALAVRSSDIIVTKPPNSYVTLMGYAVVENYGHRFSGSHTKDKVVYDEFKGTLLKFGHPKILEKNRVKREESDVYSTGHKRRRWWYPDFQMSKYIFMHQDGDITGGGKVRKFDTKKILADDSHQS